MIVVAVPVFSFRRCRRTYCATAVLLREHLRHFSAGKPVRSTTLALSVSESVLEQPLWISFAIAVCVGMREPMSQRLRSHLVGIGFAPEAIVLPPLLESLCVLVWIAHNQVYHNQTTLASSRCQTSASTPGSTRPGPGRSTPVRRTRKASGSAPAPDLSPASRGNYNPGRSSAVGASLRTFP
jgi:hypothetical protein